MVNRVRLRTHIATEDLDPTTPAAITRDGLGRITQVVLTTASVVITKTFVWHPTLTQVTSFSRTVVDVA